MSLAESCARRHRRLRGDHHVLGRARIGRPLMRYGHYVMSRAQKRGRIMTARSASSSRGCCRRHHRHSSGGRAHEFLVPTPRVMLIGSGLWCSVLAWLGVTAGQDQALLAGDLHRITLWGGGLLLLLGTLSPLLRPPAHAPKPSPSGSYRRDTRSRRHASDARAYHPRAQVSLAVARTMYGGCVLAS